MGCCLCAYVVLIFVRGFGTERQRWMSFPVRVDCTLLFRGFAWFRWIQNLGEDESGTFRSNRGHYTNL